MPSWNRQILGWRVQDNSLMILKRNLLLGSNCIRKYTTAYMLIQLV